jgi:hypothetical protein
MSVEGLKIGKAPCEHMFSALPLRADVAQRNRHVRFVRHNQTHAPQQSASIRSPRRHWSYSGNPAFRRPSINSFEVDSPRWATHADIVKAGSVSSRRAAASRASASRPRWAKAHAATSRLKSWSQGTCNRYRSRNLFAIANVPASFVSKAIF